MLKQHGVLRVQHFGIGNPCHAPLAARSCTNICHIEMKLLRFLKSKVDSVLRTLGLEQVERFIPLCLLVERKEENFYVTTSVRILLLYSNTVT